MQPVTPPTIRNPTGRELYLAASAARTGWGAYYTARIVRWEPSCLRGRSGGVEAVPPVPGWGHLEVFELVGFGCACVCLFLYLLA